MYLAGVFYIKTPNDCGNLIFEHPAKQILEYYNVEKPEKWNVYNIGARDIPVGENQLYLFPSWMIHSVSSNRNKTEERISIAFNTYHERNI